MSGPSVASVLGPSGAIARAMPGYEAREGQLKLAEAIGQAIQEPGHLIAEAGTGVGKSFAYLVPSILWAVESGGRVVVSTRTINLQEQLVLKDLPFLRKAMPVEFASELVKGRGNYISLRRLEAALGRGSGLFDGLETADEVGRIARWARQTKDGSRSDLSFRPSAEAWSAVESDPGNCLGRKCPRYRECFYFQSVRRARVAHIIVVNHALYLSDLALRRSGFSVLPDHDTVIFDEAHGLPEVAARHLGVQVSSGSVGRLLARLVSERSSRGLLSTVGLEAQAEAVRLTRSLAGQFFGQVARWSREHLPANGRVRRPMPLGNELSEALRQLGTGLATAAGVIEVGDLRMEVEAAAARCQQTAVELEGWMRQRWPDFVYWVEVQGEGKRGITLDSAPLEVGPLLRRELLEQVPSCIFTSATLSTGSPARFNYFRRELGLDGGGELVVESPFDYQRQAVLHLARGLPDPSADPEGYEREAIRALPRVLAASRGHALVLFTSYRMLDRAARELKGWFEREGLTLLSQGGEASRAKLIEEFRRDRSSVLFGVDSFWEGVDVPGDALTHLVITRLPFRVPTEPIQEARKERVEAQGGRWFDQYTVPEAVLRLKQGFGRLIRTATDTGRVTILDPRLLSKGYGRRFLEALPRCRRVIEDYGQQS